MFVGSADGGRIFQFDLNDKRDGLVLKGNLTDKIAVNKLDFDDILLAEGFSIITDVKQGPDGYLYIVSGLKQSKTEKFGAVFRMVPVGSDKLDIPTKQQQQQQSPDEKNNIIASITNTNTSNSMIKSNQENHSKKTNTNVPC